MLRALALTLVLLSLSIAPASLGAPADHRSYAGAITHDLYYKPSAEATLYRTIYGANECHGAGAAIVHVDLAAGTFEIVNPDSGCLPGFTTLSQGCALDADAHVRCERVVGDVEIRVDIAPEGAFAFTYFDASHFYEWINGTLARVA